MQSPWLASGFLVDLDGTLVSGRHVLPHATDLLERVRERFVIVSNDAEHTPALLARRLRLHGLLVPADRIVLAGTTAIDAIAREMPGAQLLLLGSRALQLHALHRGLRSAYERVPDVVLLARDRLFSFGRLTAAANALRAGVRLVVANPDRTHPGVDGAIVPETGALLAALLACAGPVPYTVVGKPEAALFQAGLRRLGCAAEDAVMIGDNPDTDGEGARRLGIRFLPVDALPARVMNREIPGLARRPLAMA
jgi:HAD superfamily hydrolase (TIGR01450 family)